MGRTYSVAGFLNAALRRSGKTILVEGPTDKALLHRIELENHPEKAGRAAIDHVGIVADPIVGGLGNRAKVIVIQSQAHALAQQAPRILDVLGTLIDREWDGVSFVGHVPVPAWQPPAQGASKFVTQGHSIENYHFDVECVIEYLKYSFAEHVTKALIDEVRSKFSALIVCATVLSLRVRDDSCIGRATGLIGHGHISSSGPRVYLDPSFSQACATRQIASAASIVADVNKAIDAAWQGLDGQDFARWLPHGHIGGETLWSGVAKIALLHGVPGAVADCIARGYQQERERFKSQWLSKAPPAQRFPLDATVQWLHS